MESFWKVSMKIEIYFHQQIIIALSVRNTTNVLLSYI